ncbi:hypothetical protein O0L34_g4721 [Tuta absoluta]|nr:hypothetical protein O0L34_g4721 [Tuta absoluta]
MSQLSNTEDTTMWLEEDLTCKPLNNLKDIQVFLLNPPAWRTLCQPIVPHSSSVVKNSEVIENNISSIHLEKQETFCHFNPERPGVTHCQEKDLPKLLVCHDMANGYHDDCKIDGTTNYEAYTFYNWSAVDIFCYFSHHLVTIPPLGWINVAHAHGVKVIGTFITEWSEGLAFWNEVNETPGTMDLLVSALVAIAKTFKFEGWLINIENKMSEPGKLLEFMKRLHTTLHQEIPNAELIWYDSVTKDGQLIWQNALNEHNRPFFDACDGLFTNYSWVPSDVESSAVEAGSRLRDVYIGIDVWGRNFYRGGKFNTQQAVKVAHQYGCSLAIFAPAWTHEAMAVNGEEDDQKIIMGENLTKLESFLLRDEAFWGSLWPFFKTRLPCLLPFKTSFCLGLGIKRRMYGEVLCNYPWFNLRHMHYQPNSRIGDHKFVLSTKTKITKASHSAIRDVRGILKFRQSFIGLNKMDKNYVENVKKDETDRKTKANHGDSIKLTEGTTEENKINSPLAVENKENDDVDNLNKNEKEQLKQVTSKMLWRKLMDIIMKNNSHLTKEPQVVKAEDQPGTSRHEETTLERQEPLIEKELSQYKLNNSATNLPLSRSTSLIQTLSPLKLQLGIEKQELSLAYIHEEKRCLEVYYQDSFNGGSCLCVSCSDHVSEDHRSIRLFHCDFPVEERLVVCVVVKNLLGFSQQRLDVWLYLMTEIGEQHVQLVGQNSELNLVESASFCDFVNQKLYPLKRTSEQFRELQEYLVVHEPGFYVPIANSYGWHVYYYQVEMRRARVTSINLRTSDFYGPILLGHFGLCARNITSSVSF